jgi:ubiquinone/menaquinone biosynthesis C-methylase UbiE
MSSLAEYLLFLAARSLYTTELAHDASMKASLQDQVAYARHRADLARRVVAAAAQYGVPIAGRRLLDLGCSDGAITPEYVRLGATSVVGVDIDSEAIQRARLRDVPPGVSFVASETGDVPLPDQSVQTVVCYDVFEHVSRPEPILRECYRVLEPGGKMLIGTWGWHHPFAPHLWSVMPVPWAHVFVSERTLLRACRRVYTAPWYRSTMHDLDAQGRPRPSKYLDAESISTDYLNKLLIRDFERVFSASAFRWKINAVGFSNPLARWTHPLLRVPWIREFVTAYIWVVLERPSDS